MLFELSIIKNHFLNIIMHKQYIALKEIIKSGKKGPVIKNRGNSTITYKMLFSM